MKGTFVFPFHLVAIGIAVLAVLLMCLGLPDSWFFGLLTLAALSGAMGEAFRENKPGAWMWLAAAAVFAAAAVRTMRTAGRSRRGSS